MQLLYEEELMGNEATLEGEECPTDAKPEMGRKKEWLHSELRTDHMLNE